MASRVLDKALHAIVKLEVHLGMANIPGGLTEEKAVTEHDRELFMDTKLKAEVEAQLNKSFELFEPLKYRQQVVAGTIFFVKIKVDNDGDCIHVKIFKPLPHVGRKLEVVEVQTGKTVNDPIEFF